MQENVAIQPEEPPALPEAMAPFADDAFADDVSVSEAALAPVAAGTELPAGDDWDADDGVALEDVTVTVDEGASFADDEDDDDFFSFVVDAAEDAATLSDAEGAAAPPDDPRLAEMADALQMLRDSEIGHALRELRDLFPHIPFPFRVRALIAVRHGALAA